MPATVRHVTPRVNSSQVTVDALRRTTWQTLVSSRAERRRWRSLRGNVLGMWTVASSRLRRTREYFTTHTLAYGLFLAVFDALAATLDHLTTGRPWSHVAETAAVFWLVLMGLYGLRRYGVLAGRRVNLMAGYTAGRDARWRYESIEMSRGRLATSAASSIADAGTMGSCYRDDSSCNPDDRDREPKPRDRIRVIGKQRKGEPHCSQYGEQDCLQPPGSWVDPPWTHDGDDIAFQMLRCAGCMAWRTPRSRTAR